MKKNLIADIGQWGGMLALIAGIGLMIYDNNAAGETVIAIGSLIYAITTKIKYYRERRKENGHSFKVSDKGLENRTTKRGHHKRSQLADDDSLGGYFPRRMETGSDGENDGSRAD